MGNSYSSIRSEKNKGSDTFLHISDEQAVLILAFNGGLYDAAGYMELQQLFTSSITGNIVVSCASAFTVDGTIARSCTTVSFFLAAGIGGALSIFSKTRHSFSTRISSALLMGMYLSVIIIVIILGFQFADEILVARENEEPNNSYVVLLGSLMGAAMGFHNAAAKEAVLNCPPTTVMTSTLVNVATNASNAIVYYFSNMNDKYHDSRGKFITTIKPLISFIIGALIGSAVTHYGRFWFGIIPIFTCSFLIFELLCKEHEVRLSLLQSTKNFPPNDIGISNSFEGSELVEIEIESDDAATPSSKSI